MTADRSVHLAAPLRSRIVSRAGLPGGLISTATAAANTLVIAAPATPQSLDCNFDVSLGTFESIAALYDKDDFVNVVTDFTLEQHKGGKQKANPKGAGKTLLRDYWMRAIRDNGAPQSKAGASRPRTDNAISEIAFDRLRYQPAPANGFP